jgi:hypothetical protein
MTKLKPVFTPEEDKAKAKVKVGDVVCAWLRINGVTCRAFAKVVIIHGNGSLRVDHMIGKRMIRTECGTWRMLQGEELSRYAKLYSSGKAP